MKMPEIKTKPYMLQRLSVPHIRNGKVFINPFSFGGGYKNGGLSDEAMGFLSPLFRFDYMGRAEFEMGILPKCLGQIAALAVDGQMVSGEQKVSSDGKNGALYFYCPIDIRDDVIKIVKNLACARPSFRLKESAFVHEALYSEDARWQELIGWIDVENNYLFFKNKEIRDKTKDMFTDFQKTEECAEFIG